MQDLENLGISREITYKTNAPLSVTEIIEVFDSSGIRRPTNDSGRIEKMFKNSNLVVSAWLGKQLIGLGRALTDFSYCCYVSDLAVKKEFQSKGIGKIMLEILRNEAGPQTVFFLHAAPQAVSYYPKIGMHEWKDCFYIPRANFLILSKLA